MKKETIEQMESRLTKELQLWRCQMQFLSYRKAQRVRAKEVKKKKENQLT